MLFKKCKEIYKNFKKKLINIENNYITLRNYIV